MPEQTFGEFMSSLAYYGIRSSLNKANLFGIQDMFKFVTDPKRMPTFIQRNILTSLQPRILKDIKKDIQLGQKNLGIMSEAEFNRTRSQKLISNRFDESPFIRNFRILLDEYSTGRIEGRTKDGFRKATAPTRRKTRRSHEGEEGGKGAIESGRFQGVEGSKACEQGRVG